MKKTIIWLSIIILIFACCFAFVGCSKAAAFDKARIYAKSLQVNNENSLLNAEVNSSTGMIKFYYKNLSISIHENNDTFVWYYIRNGNILAGEMECKEVDSSIIKLDFRESTFDKQIANSMSIEAATSLKEMLNLLDFELMSVGVSVRDLGFRNFK